MEATVLGPATQRSNERKSKFITESDIETQTVYTPEDSPNFKYQEKLGTKSDKTSIDLLGVKCPFNYVKTKIKLETMAPGSILEVLLDSGEPSENVPKSIKNDGHKVVSLVEEQDHYKLTIEKA